MKTFHVTVAAAVLSAASVAAHADVSFVDGSILVNGSASDGPGGAPSDSAIVAGTVTPGSATGSGSTGSGLAGATATLNGTIDDMAFQSVVKIVGSASASQPPGYPGFANITVQTAGLDFSPDPLILSLDETSYFRIKNAGNVNVTFTPVTGSVVGNTLTAGTYKISFLLFASVSEGQTNATNTLDWTLQVSTSPLADFNIDGKVDGADLGTLLAGWGTAAADLDGDGTTSGSDLGILLAAWG
ncbi:MAG: hypothetical protein JNM94_04990 [Phycisphaerae bacterium]|nr:hypothetical protein [Phycisphaerae bacterium]